jgi:hypothetical protein
MDSGVGEGWELTDVSFPRWHGLAGANQWWEARHEVVEADGDADKWRGTGGGLAEVELGVDPAVAKPSMAGCSVWQMQWRCNRSRALLGLMT